MASDDADDEMLVAPTLSDHPPKKIKRRKAEIMRGRRADGSDRPAILICGETESFRRLARSQVLASDSIIEIGCSYGLATESLAARAQRVLAVDVSEDALQRAAERCARFDNVQLANLDATRELPRLLRMAREMSASVLFLDINGDRPARAVAPLLQHLRASLSPAIIVVKNRELFDAAQEHERMYQAQAMTHSEEQQRLDAAELPAGATFWRNALLAASAAASATRPAQNEGSGQPARPPSAAAASDFGHPADSAADRELIAEWRATAGTHAVATVLYSEPSTMGAGMRVEVRERPGGWRTMHQVSDDTFSRHEIMNGIARIEGATGGAVVDDSAPVVVVSEYLRTMAAVAFAALERSHSAVVEDDDSGAESLDAPGESSRRPPRFLFLGLGAGILPRLVAHHYPASEIVAVEYDDAVSDAARRHMRLDEGRVQIVRADALQWVEHRAAEAAGAAEEATGAEGIGAEATGAEGEGAEIAAERSSFDAVLIDVFDEHNACPPAFYSDGFLSAVASITSDTAVVVHNLHDGSKALNVEAERAWAAYTAAFGASCCCRLAALDSKPWAGNTIIGATRDGSNTRDFFAPGGIGAAAATAREDLGVAFDLAARCKPSSPAAVAAARKAVQPRAATSKRKTTGTKSRAVSDLFRPDSLGGGTTEGTTW